MVMGLPGSGKTYFAKAFAHKIRGLHINNDMVRKELDQHPKYSGEDKNRVYTTVFEKACQALGEGEVVVVDATFSKLQYRKPYYDYAQKNKIPMHVILIQADEHTIAKRLLNQRPDSDADFAVYEIIKAEFEPLKLGHLTLASDKYSLKEMINKSLDYIVLEQKVHDGKSNS
jgi:predicted kinase